MITITQWRAAIAGSNVRLMNIMRRKHVSGRARGGTNASCMMLATYVAAVVAVLLVIGGIEQNPGPLQDNVNISNEGICQLF